MLTHRICTECIHHARRNEDETAGAPFEVKVALFTMVCKMTVVLFQMSYPGGVDLSTFHRDHKESSIWEVWNVTANRVLMPASPTTSFAVLTFEIKMRRRLVFSSYMLTMPPVFLACITLVVFWLPPERPDRTALGERVVIISLTTSDMCCCLENRFLCLSFFLIGQQCQTDPPPPHVCSLCVCHIHLGTVPSFPRITLHARCCELRGN